MRKLLLTFIGILPAFYLLGQLPPPLKSSSTPYLKLRTSLSLSEISFTNPDFGNHIDGINHQIIFQEDLNPSLQGSTLAGSIFRNSLYLSYNLNSIKDQKTATKDFNSNLFTPENEHMASNRRLKYSSLWAFTSLNYLYADLLGVMDVNLLTQYQTGTVNGVVISPEFLTFAAAYMQLPLANVFLPHVIKNDKALRWIQIVSGSIATLVQASTLFVGKPTPYYILFSAIEIGATAYITFDALKWKPGAKK